MDDLLAIELEAALPGLIDTFYARVRQDPALGPVFNQAVGDWEHHLTLLVEFWSSVMLGTKSFRGNPMRAHLKHAAHIRPEMFSRWLAIWNATTDERLSRPAAALIQAKAARIGQSLDMALHYRPVRDEPAVEATAQEAKSTPYRSTPVFTNTTLPPALRAAHATRDGVWGVIRVLEGQVRYQVEAETQSQLLSPGVPGFVLPQQRHHVEPIGEIRMQVEFYDHPPRL
jgi:hemoglobin